MSWVERLTKKRAQSLVSVCTMRNVLPTAKSNHNLKSPTRWNKIHNQVDPIVTCASRRGEDIILLCVVNASSTATTSSSFCSTQTWIHVPTRQCKPFWPDQLLIANCWPDYGHLFSWNNISSRTWWRLLLYPVPTSI